MSLLAVDIGNSSTTFGMYEGTTICSRFHIPTRTLTHRELTRESLASPLKDLPAPSIIGIASVVPWASDEIIVVLHESYPEALIMVVTSGNIPIAIDYPHPEELGTDRLLGALAAFTHWGSQSNRPCIVVDLGTATTFDCITAEGKFLGGAIAPGIELGAEALSLRAAQLPTIDLSFPTSIIGRTTIESMQSGILYGALALVEGFVDRLAKFAFNDQRPIVVATGGFSRFFEGRTTVFDHLSPDLVLDGVRIASELIAENMPDLEIAAKNV